MKKVFLSLFITFFFLLLGGGVFFSGILSPFEVLGEEKDSIREVSEGGFLSLQFSRPMNKQFFQENLLLEPSIPFSFEWKNNRTVFIFPQEPLEVGSTLSLSFQNTLKDFFGNSLEKNNRYTFRVVGKPEVVLALPQGETEVKNKIVITFNRPMTVLTSLDEEESQKQPVSISPFVSGKFHWLGTSALEFVPDDRFFYATKYTVTVDASMKDLTGGSLGEDYVFTFQTPKPALQSVQIQIPQKQRDKSKETTVPLYELQGYRYAYGGNALVLSFNQSIDIDRAKDFISLQNLRESSKGNEEDKKDQEFSLSYATNEAGELDSTTLLLNPHTSWEEGKNYSLTIQKSLYGKEGDLREEEGLYHYSFSGAVHPYVQYVQPKDASVLASENQWSTNTRIEIRFSSPMNPEKFSDYISISPEVDVFTENEIIYLSHDDTLFSDYWNLQPSTKYTVTLSKNLPDRFGRTLGEDYRWSFTSASLMPNLSLETRGENFGVFESGIPPMYRINYVNIKKVYAGLAKISFQDMIDIREESRSSRQWNPLLSNYELLKKWDFDIPKNTNVPTVQNLEIAKFFKTEDKRFESGIFLLDVWSPEVKDYRGNIVHNIQIFHLTPYALTLKYDRDSALVWAGNLKDGLPVEDMKVSLLDVHGKAQDTGITNIQGVAELAFDPQKVFDGKKEWNTEFFVVGEKEGKQVFVGSNWNDGIAPWKFGLRENWPGISENPHNIVGKIYTDRPLYKPGETVYFKGILREFDLQNYSIPENVSVSIKVYDGERNEIWNKNTIISDFGSFDGEFQIPEEVSYGQFSLDAEIDAPNIDDTWKERVLGDFWVSHFQKAPFQVKVTVPKEEYLWGDLVEGTITAETYYGAKLADQEVNFSVNSTDYYFNRYDGEWYSFSTLGNWCWWNCNRGNHFISSESLTLDNSGTASFSFPLTSKKDESSPVSLSQVYLLSASVYDQKSNREITGTREFIAHYTDLYLGVKTDNYVIRQGEKAFFKVVSLNRDASPKPYTSFTAKLIKREYKTIKRQNVDGMSYYENETQDTEMKTLSLKTDEFGKLSSFFTPESGGSYIIQVSSKDSQKHDVLAESDIWVSSLQSISWPRANHDRIDIIADKQQYRVGDVAQLLIKSPYSHVKALLTTEQDHILTKKVIDIDSNAQTIEVPITQEDVPNVYVSVVLLKGRESSGDYDPDTRRDMGQPNFKIGYIKLPVELETKELQVSITSPKERYLPQEEVTLDLTVKDFEGKPAQADVAVMVVDMSLLALTGYEEPNLLDIFYSERGVGVKTSLTMAKFIERFKPGAKGGGGGDEKKARGEFKNTAYWVASTLTNESGKSQVKFQLPDNLTTWKVTAIAQDKSHRFGAGSSEFMETKRIIIDPSLPQFFHVGDEVKVKTVITNKQEKSVSIQASLDIQADENGDPHAEVIGKQEYSIKLQPDERKDVIFTLRTHSPGNLSLLFHAKSGEDEDILLETRRIDPFITKEVVATSGILSEIAHEEVYLPKDIVPNIGDLQLQLSPTLAYLLPHNLKLLRSYPYECMEQVISKIFPNVLVLQNSFLTQLFSENEKEEIRKEAQQRLSQVYTEQNGDGSWGYFISSTKYRDYLTAYVLLALGEMKKSGFSVEEKVIQKAEEYLDSRRNGTDLVREGFIRWALAASGKRTTDLEYAQRTLQELLNNPESKGSIDFPYFAYIYWALATGSKELLEPVLEAVEQTDRGAFIQEKTEKWSAYWSTSKRTTALLLYALEYLEPSHPYVPKIVSWMNANRNAEGYGNTQENVWMLLALIRHVEQEKLENINFKVSVDLLGDPVLEKFFSTQSLLESSGERKEKRFEKTLQIGTSEDVHFDTASFLKNIQELPQGENISVDFSKEGKGKAYYDMILSYYLPVENIQAREEGFSIIREMYTLDGKKLNTLPPVGETFKIRLTLVAPREGNFVAVEDFIPSGILPINTDFATERTDLDKHLKNSGEKWWEWGVLQYFRHEEFRDDRVFLFAEWLPAGVYQYEYAARVTHEGSFAYPPARIFEMYNEDRFGRTAGSQILIKQK